MEKIRIELQDNSYNWLVTGAAGFIGSHLVQFLLDNNQNVLASDNFSTGLKKNIAFLNSYHQSLKNNSKFKFIESDIRDYDKCLQITDGIDFVLHQAAIGSVPRSIKDLSLIHI